MKTILGVFAGALCGAAITFAYFKANPPGQETLANTQEQLANTQFDLNAAKKAENRLRDQVAELKQSNELANAELVAVLEENKTKNWQGQRRDIR